MDNLLLTTLLIIICFSCDIFQSPPSCSIQLNEHSDSGYVLGDLVEITVNVKDVDEEKCIGIIQVDDENIPVVPLNTGYSVFYNGWSSTFPYYGKFSTAGKSPCTIKIKAIIYETKGNLISDGLDFQCEDETTITIKEDMSWQQYASTFIDKRDNNVYKTIKIGNQIWMAENLRYVTNNGSWVNSNEIDIDYNIGRLYNWTTAKEVSPEGWHLPGKEEWQELYDFLGSNPGMKLSASSGFHPGSSGTNSAGFFNLPTGEIGYGGSLKTGAGKYWTSTEISAYVIAAYYTQINSSGGVVFDDLNAVFGFAVRCVKDN